MTNSAESDGDPGATSSSSTGPSATEDSSDSGDSGSNSCPSPDPAPAEDSSNSRDTGATSSSSIDSASSGGSDSDQSNNAASASAMDSPSAADGAPVMTLAEFLQSANVGVEYSNNAVHIGIAFLDALHISLDIAEVVTPPLIAEGAASGVAATIGGLGFTVAGPILGMVGVFAALGSGYEEAREEIKNEAIASGFSQGFVAGILNVSAGTVSSIFGKHGVVSVNTWDPQADVIETNAYNRGLVAGYTMANLASADEKKSFVLEIRKFTGYVPVGNWTDSDKRTYVIDYAAKLRLNFLRL